MKGHGALPPGDRGKGEAEMSEWTHKNEVTLVGVALAAPDYSHTNHGERFCKFPLRVLRLSGQMDELVVIAGERLLRSVPVERGTRLCLQGELRSYNNKSGQGSRLVITVFAHCMESGTGQEDQNRILLTGALCKAPVRRRTPLGREICDLMLAEETGSLAVGDTLAFEGRVQSRIYRKTTERGTEERTAYEVSVMRLEQERADSCIILPEGWS